MCSGPGGDPDARPLQKKKKEKNGSGRPHCAGRVAAHGGLGTGASMPSVLKQNGGAALTAETVSSTKNPPPGTGKNESIPMKLMGEI